MKLAHMFFSKHFNENELPIKNESIPYTRDDLV